MIAVNDGDTDVFGAKGVLNCYNCINNYAIV